MGAAGRDEKAKGWLGRLGSGSISVGGPAWRESPAGANEVKREGAGATPRHHGEEGIAMRRRREVCCLRGVTVIGGEGSGPSSGTSQGKAT